MGSNYFPAGPHGEKQDPRELPLHPGDKRNRPQPEEPGGAPPARSHVRTDTAWDPADGLASIVSSVLLLLICWALWACLYPLAAVGAVSAFFGARPILRAIMAPFDRTEGDAAWLLAFLIAMVVMVMLSRLDHRLARYAAYYWPRHFVRLALFGVLAMRSIVQDSKVLPGPGEPLVSLFLLQFRQNQVIILAVIVSMHFLLWKAGWLRRFWHRRLEAIGLRG